MKKHFTSFSITKILSSWWTLVAGTLIFIGIVAIFAVPKMIAHYSVRYYTQQVEKGRQAFAKDDMKTAETAFNRALAYKSPDPTIYRDLAFIYKRQQKDKESAEALQQYLTDDENSAVSWNSLGNNYRELKQYDKAEAAYLKALELNSNYMMAVTNLSHLYQLSGSKDKSIALLKSYFDGTRQRAEIGLLLAVAYKAEGNKEEARKVLEQILSVDPENSKAKTLLNGL